MDPLTANLLLWIGASVLSVASVGLIIVAETRLDARLDATATSDEQQMESRFSREDRELAQTRSFQP